jgi:hypothetical protein
VIDPRTLEGLIVAEDEVPGLILVRCAVCGGPVPPKRPGGLGGPRRVYCSARCLQRTQTRGRR